MATLSAGTVGHVSVPTPGYDRAKVTVGIAHFGVGAFHRSHEAMYLDRLMNAGHALDWGVCGIGVRDADRRMQQVMQDQDYLYTLVLKHPDGSWEPRVIGSIVEYLYAPDDVEAVIEKLADSQVRIVSLTVTEGGYSADHVTGELDVTDPLIAADLQPGATPRSVFGLIAEALARRRDRAVPAFTVMSCDNIQGNGNLSRRVLTTFAELRDPQLAEWIRSNVSFPNSMVDRITPVTTDDDRREIARRYDVVDAWPVVAEPYEQWVLQDDFSAGRPEFQHVGVQLVERVEPYELMKLRLLNASHQVMSYFGYLAGYRYVDDVVHDPEFSRLLLDYMHDEAVPTLEPVPGVDLDRYCATLIERFGNPGVRDTLARNCFNASDRIPVFLLPVIRHQLAAGGDFTRAAATVASWAFYSEGVDDQGEHIDVFDPLRAELHELAVRQAEEPTAFLTYTPVFGDLASDSRFVDVYVAVLDSLRRDGAAATVAALNRGSF